MNRSNARDMALRTYQHVSYTRQCYSYLLHSGSMLDSSHERHGNVERRHLHNVDWNRGQDA